MYSIQELADDLDDNKLMLTIKKDDWNGVCHPDIDNETLVKRDKHGAPYNWRTSGDPPSPEKVGELFAQEFNSKVDAVYNLIDNSDEPLDAIMDLEPDNLIQSPSGSPQDNGNSQ